MKLTLIEIPKPMITEFEMFKSLNKDDIMEAGKVQVSYSLETKTRISTSMKCGNAMNSINWNVDGYALHKETKISYMDGRTVTKYFFKKSKKQGYSEYLKYLEKLVKIVLENLGVPHDAEITVEIQNNKRLWL